MIFYRLAQFVHDGVAAVAQMRWILDRGYTIAFARERIAIATPAELDRLFPLLATSGWLDGRDRDRAFVRAVLPALAAYEAAR